MRQHRKVCVLPDFISVHIVAATPAEADQIAHALVTERLAACVNILPAIRSIYRWQGKVEQGQEYLLIAKTHAGSFDAVAKRVKELHSYDCPCIVALPLVAGTDDYLAWIGESIIDSPD